MRNVSSIQANITINLLRENKGIFIKAFLSVTPCYLFLYINGMMIFTLRSKTVFLEKPRYILFGHMLYIDSIQLVSCAILYLLAITSVYLTELTCFCLIVAGTVLSRISPLNLVLMSLERFVAICLPLRHAQMSTLGRTRCSLCFIWVLGSLDSLTALLVFVIHKSPSPTLSQRYCSRLALFDADLQTIHKAYTIVYFMAASIIITYTYIAIFRAARSLTGGRKSASKSNKTVLLHLVQLALCLSSIFFDIFIERLRYQLQAVTFLNVQYFLFMILIIFPRCLSPLIYGLRDKAFSCWFKHYFCFGQKRVVKPVETQLSHMPE